PEELEVYTISKLILKDTVVLDRIFYRDNKRYYNVLLDNNIRKWILRFYMNNKGMKIELNNGLKELISIESPLVVSNHSEKIIKIVNEFLLN
ncbi:endonuclease, partial [Enterococcus faecalis]